MKLSQPVDTLYKAWAQFQTVSRLQDQRVSASHEVHTGICSFEEGKNRIIFLNKKKPYIPAVQNCLTLNTFICQRKSQIMLKKNTTFKKCANVGRGKCAKCCLHNLPIINNSVSQGINGLAQNCTNTRSPPTRWVRLK